MKPVCVLLAVVVAVLGVIMIERVIDSGVSRSFAQVVEPAPAPPSPSPVPFIATGITSDGVYVLGAVPTPGCERDPEGAHVFEYAAGAPFVEITSTSTNENGVGVYTLRCSGAALPSGKPVSPMAFPYYVTYAICGGRAGPARGTATDGRLLIYIWLCDEEGRNVSQREIMVSLMGFASRVIPDVTAERRFSPLSGILPFVDQPPGTAGNPPGFGFIRVYRVDLALGQLPPGDYDLFIAAEGDAVTHAVPFVVR